MVAHQSTWVNVSVQEKRESACCVTRMSWVRIEASYESRCASLTPALWETGVHPEASRQTSFKSASSKVTECSWSQEIEKWPRKAFQCQQPLISTYACEHSLTLLKACIHHTRAREHTHTLIIINRLFAFCDISDLHAYALFNDSPRKHHDIIVCECRWLTQTSMR